MNYLIPILSYLSFFRIYLSADSSQREGSSPGNQVSVLSPTYSEPDTKSCIIEAIPNPSVPKHALQAFQFLSKSPEAQVINDVLCPNESYCISTTF